MMAARLKRLGYKFSLDMYGRGEYESQTKSLVSKLEVEDVVHFMGTNPMMNCCKICSNTIFFFLQVTKMRVGAL